MFGGRTIFRRGVGALVLVVTSCGVVVEITGVPDPSVAGDGGAEAEASSDAGALDGPGGDGGLEAEASAPCTDHMAFVAIEALPELGMASSLRLAAGGSVAFVAAHGLGDLEGDQIYEGPFPKGGASYTTAIASPWDDSHPAPTSDRTSLYFEHDAGIFGRQVAIVSRSAGTGPFSVPLILDLADGGRQTREPYIVRDGAALYFTMDPGQAGGRDIYRAEKSGGSGWAITLVGGAVSTSSPESHPVVSEDELTIFFSRGPGASEIWTATRASKSAPFDVADPVGALNVGTADDRPSWLSPDRCTLYFTSDRDGGVYGVFRARRR